MLEFNHANFNMEKKKKKGNKEDLKNGRMSLDCLCTRFWWWSQLLPIGFTLSRARDESECLFFIMLS